MKSLSLMAIAFAIAGMFTIAQADMPDSKNAVPDNSSLNLTAEQNQQIQTLRESRWKELNRCGCSCLTNSRNSNSS